MYGTEQYEPHPLLYPLKFPVSDPVAVSVALDPYPGHSVGCLGWESHSWTDGEERTSQ